MFKLNPFAEEKNTLKDPQSFMLPLAEPVKVVRTNDGILHLQWQEQVDRVTIFVGSDPHTLLLDKTRLTPILSVSCAREAMVTGLDTAVRHYFHLEFKGGAWDGRSLIAAERTLPLQKGINFRDAGGYHTQDGQMVRWGKLYRSGSMSELSPDDLAYLHRLSIKLVCDLRSEEEREKRPDRLPENDALVERPLPMESLDRWDRLRGAFTIFFRKGYIDNLMRDLYQRVMIDTNAQLIGDIFEQLADEATLPAVIHCTAGKDRTGLVCALLLLTLGVPEETVLADYTLSNLFYDHFRTGIAAELKQLAPWGLSVDDLQDLLLVKAKTMQETLAHIRQNYGSIDTYLRDETKVSDETMQRLRENWLMAGGEMDN